MAYFARKIRYCANQFSFVALIEIVKKKGGKPVKFILYRYQVSGDKEKEIHEIIEFNESKKEAEESFPYGSKNLWRKTTDWLYKIGVGGGYGFYPKGTWIKIGRSAPWKKRRMKKFRLRFGQLGHIFLATEKRIKILYREMSGIENSLGFTHDDDCNCIACHVNEKRPEHAVELETKLSEKGNEFDAEKVKQSAIKEEMKFVRNKKFKKGE